MTENLGPRVAARVAARVVAVSHLRGDLPLMFEFPAGPDPGATGEWFDPEARWRLLELCWRLIRAPAREQVTVNVVEDVHWIDPANARLMPDYGRRTGR
jgi:adenylate cyclase